MSLPVKSRSERNSLYNSVSKIPRLLKESSGKNSDGLTGENFPSDVLTHEDDTFIVEAVHVPSGASQRITYTNVKTFGTGSFGVVYVATLLEPEPTTNGTREVAIKKVLQDERYKNRELQILKEMHHINVVALYYYFYSHTTSASKSHETYLNLVQEFVPQTLSRLIKHYYRIRQVIPLAFVKLYSFQLLRGLAYIHSLNVCHRDIKPQNLLINPEQGTLKICDFGSAKILDPLEANVSYICSRYYRAPELIFGATHYTVLIDMWSAGCVIGELLLGRPLFPGGTGVDQLVEIIKVLGTPTPEQVLQMNPQYTEFKFPQISGSPWEKIIRHRTNDSAFSVLRRLLVYNPKERACASEILADSFFADLIFPPPGHPPNAIGRLPNGKPAPQFPMEFTEDELNYLPSDLVERIRACQRAVAEVELSSSFIDATSSLDDGQRTPTNKTVLRSRITKPSEDSSLSAHSKRPVSGGFISQQPIASRSSGTSGPLSTSRNRPNAASVADVRRSAGSSRHLMLDPHDLSNEPMTKRLSVPIDRSISQQHLPGNAAPSNGFVKQRPNRTGKDSVTRHSLYSQSSKN